MNINLVFEGKNYNFDIPNNVTIEYIKELSSKIFNSDKALLDLLYNNQKIENKDDNTLIRDLIPEGETNTILTVQVNKDLANSNKNEIIPLVSLKNKIIENNENEKDNEINEKILKKEKKANTDKKNSDKKIIHIIKNKKKGNNSRNKNIINNDNKNINLIKREFDIKIFQTNFIQKNKELLELMKEFNNKIKEVYLILYKKYKNSGGSPPNTNISPSNNSSISSSISIGLSNNYYYELSIYEKKLITFQEKQINYYKKLLELIKKYDKNKDIFQLNDFYTILIANNNSIKSYTNKEDKFDPSNYLKFKKLANNKIFLNSHSLLANNLSSLNINNDNHLPILKNKNLNSSLEKKNISYNFNNNISNNISSINSIKTNSKGNNFNNKLNIDKEKEIFQKNNNNINKGINSSKINKNPLSFESKITINNTIKNNNLNNNKENNNIIEKDKDNENSSYNSDNLSEKDLVDNITIKENKNKSKIAPIPLHIRNSVSNINIIPKKYMVINNSLRRNSLINNINYNNNGGIESIDKNIEEKKRPKLLRFSSVNDFQNKLKNTPILNKKITINEISQNRSKRKGLNDSINEGGIFNMKKIKDIDISSMTVNDSNFIRDKQKSNKKKSNKDMNKYDFLV